MSLVLRALLWKEFRQMRRSRGAILSAALFPFLLLVVEPWLQVKGLASGVMTGLGGPLLARFGGQLGLFTQLSVPLFVTLAGVLVAPVIATHSVVAERERGSLDLLLALPATVREILHAKVLSVLLLGTGVVTPLFLVEATTLTAQGLVTTADTAFLFLVLLGALTCSVGITIGVTVLARDYRTARQISTLPVMFILFLTVVILFAIPGHAGLVALAAALAALGGLGSAVAQRWLTAERYLS
jgi:Cu-processing system permease protein